jgi:hypothetical protein
MPINNESVEENINLFSDQETFQFLHVAHHSRERQLLIFSNASTVHFLYLIQAQIYHAALEFRLFLDVIVIPRRLHLAHCASIATLSTIECILSI